MMGNNENYNAEYEDFLGKLFDRESMIVNMTGGAIVPMSHPDFYKDRVDISVSKQYGRIDGFIKVEQNEYKVTPEKVTKLEKLLQDNFSNLLEVAKKQTTEMYEGVSEELIIKFGSIMIMISSTNATNTTDCNFIENFRKAIISVLTTD